jgi:hypothetical protein
VTRSGQAFLKAFKTPCSRAAVPFKGEAHEKASLRNETVTSLARNNLKVMLPFRYVHDIYT